MNTKNFRFLPCDKEHAKMSVGAGWHPLIEELYALLEERNFPVKVIQVKEKFGGLRVYTSIYDKDIEDKIVELSLRSHHICETCGEPGETRKTSVGCGETRKTPAGWLVTVCPQHGKDTIPLSPVFMNSLGVSYPSQL